MAGDWIKAHRSMMDSAVWNDEWLVKLWMWCLFKANHRDGTYRGTAIKRGQFITGRNTASDELGVSPSKWYRGIQRLVDFGNIAIAANSEWTMITVCNYTTYQDKAEPIRTANEQRSDSQRTASGQPADTIEECKNNKNGRMEETHTPSPSTAAGAGVPASQEKKSTAKKSKDGEPDGFAEWYAAYPRHEARGSAAKAYERAVKAFMVRDEMERPMAVQALLEATRLFADSDAGKSGSFTPHPATWLNSARYFDDPQTWKREEQNGRKRFTIGAGQTYNPDAGKSDPNFGKM